MEIMPVGYTEHSFSMLSTPCKIWFYEIQSMALSKHRDRYEETCGDKVPHMFQPCVGLKNELVWVNVSKIIPVVTNALERLGYDTGKIWYEDNVYE